MISVELPWLTKTLFTSAFTIMADIIIGSLCPIMIPSRLELEKTISGVDDGLCVFFIFSDNKLKIS